MTVSRRLTTRVQAIMRSGGSLDDIEAWLEDGPVECDPGGLELSSEQKAALWLYAWSLLPQYQQRARATASTYEAELHSPRRSDQLPTV